MTRIESRPLRSGLGRYMFFCDLEGALADEPVTAAVEALRGKAETVRILGSSGRNRRRWAGRPCVEFPSNMSTRACAQRDLRADPRLHVAPRRRLLLKEKAELLERRDRGAPLRADDDRAARS